MEGARTSVVRANAESVPQGSAPLCDPFGVDVGLGDRDPGVRCTTLGFAVGRLRRDDETLLAKRANTAKRGQSLFRGGK